MVSVPWYKLLIFPCDNSVRTMSKKHHNGDGRKNRARKRSASLYITTTARRINLAFHLVKIYLTAQQLYSSLFILRDKCYWNIAITIMLG